MRIPSATFQVKEQNWMSAQNHSDIPQAKNCEHFDCVHCIEWSLRISAEKKQFT